MDIPVLQLLDSLYALLRICDHLGEQKGKAGLAELGRLGAIERAVVDGFAIAGHAEAGIFARGGAWREGRHPEASDYRAE